MLLSRDEITPNNYGPAVSIVTWILVVSMTLSVCTKIAIKAIARHSFDADDAVLFAAMVISVAQSITFSIQTSKGVGKHLSSLTISQTTSYQKACYSADILYIISLAISKISVLVLLWQITPIARHRRLALCAGYFIAVWTIASFFAAVFQCRIPKPWLLLGPHCFDRISFWTAYGVINLLTEGSVIALPIYTVWNLHMSLKRKAVAISCFGLRILVIGAIIIQLTLLNRRRSAQDTTFYSWSYYISTQVVQSLSVITACIPYIKNVLSGVESGMFQTGHFRLATLRKEHAGNDEPHSSTTRSGTATTVDVPTLVNGSTDHETSRDGKPVETPRINPFPAQNTAVAEAVTPNGEWDRESQSSQANIIKHTRAWQVAYEDV